VGGTVAAMQVIDGAAVPAEGDRPPEPVCVLLPPGAADRLIPVARWLGVDTSVAERLRASSPRRPLVHVDRQRISLVAFAVDELGLALAVHVHVGDGGLLVLSADATVPVIRRAVAGVAGGREDALVAVLIALAQSSEEAVQRLSDTALALDASTTGITSGPRRRAIARTRGMLFSLQQLWTSHRQLLAAANALSEALPAAVQPGLRRAGGIFESSSTSAGQLYALLGDTLSRQATIINERLTLVAVIFFPLTVSTGFFGMNFGWLTDRIGSAAAFVLFGILLPCVLVLATLLGARWLTRD
jgi:CorA-like Mg2+ transporter protein